MPIDPRDKGHKDPEIKDLNVPRRAQYLQSAWKKHQDAVFWVDVDLAIRKGLTNILSNSIECNHPSRNTSSFLYSKSCQPKISLRHDWTTELVSEVAQQPREEVAQQPRGEVSRQAKFFQPTQPIPKPICDRSGQPDNKHEVFVDEGETSWSKEIREKSSPWSRQIKDTSSHEELCSSDRSGQPDFTPSVIEAQTNLSEEIRVEQTHDRSGQPDKHEIAPRAAPEVHREILTLNTDNELTRERIEEDMDFKNPGLPHSIVKQLQSASVRELVQKSRTTRTDTLFNKTYNRVNHLIPSVKNPNK